MKTENIYPHLTTDDPKWKDKAQALVENGQPCDIYDLNVTDHTSFVIELARQYCSPEHFKIENGHAVLRPKDSA